MNLPDLPPSEGGTDPSMNYPKMGECRFCGKAEIPLAILNLHMAQCIDEQLMEGTGN